jgi:hypothetical protein
MPNGMMAELKKMYNDLAGAAYAGMVASLRQLVTPDKILFGTDFPPGGHILEQAQAIRELKMFNDDELKLVERDNAVKLIPRLKNTQCSFRRSEHRPTPIAQGGSGLFCVAESPGVTSQRRPLRLP